MMTDNKITIFPPASSSKELKEEPVSGFAQVNGITMYYEIHKSSANVEGIPVPLVLIHGGGSTIKTTFGHMLPLLAPHYQVIALELQGHGRTSDRDQEESFDQDAADVMTLLQYLKIDKANFLGFSNGGNTAMQIAVKYPTIVNKLVIASSFYKRDGMIPGFFEGLEQATLADMPALLRKGYIEVAADKEQLHVMFEKDKERMLRFIDTDEETIRSIKAATLIMAADHDVVTVEHTVEMFRTFPNSRLAILPGGHGGYIGEITEIKEGSKIPDLSVEIIKEFLNG